MDCLAAAACTWFWLQCPHFHMFWLHLIAVSAASTRYHTPPIVGVGRQILASGAQNNATRTRNLLRPYACYCNILRLYIIWWHMLDPTTSRNVLCCAIHVTSSPSSRIGFLTSLNQPFICINCVSPRSLSCVAHIVCELRYASHLSRRLKFILAGYTTIHLCVWASAMQYWCASLGYLKKMHKRGL